MERITISQFKVTLMNSFGMREHLVNCANESFAKFICEGLFPNMRVVDVVKNSDTIS